MLTAYDRWWEYAQISKQEETVACYGCILLWTLDCTNFWHFLNKPTLILLACIFVFLASHEIDEYELVDPVDILTPLEKSGFWDGVVSIVPVSDIFLTNCTTYFFFFDTSDSQLEF